MQLIVVSAIILAAIALSQLSWIESAKPWRLEISHNNLSRSDLSRYQEDGDTRIPFWNIAHMINSADEIEGALNEGANGIEVDISFDGEGVPVFTYHGIPCDCGRHCLSKEDFVKYVQQVGKLTLPPASSKLLLVLFDLKLKDLNQEQKEVAGRRLATILHENLYQHYIQATTNQYMTAQPVIRTIISVNHVTDSNLIKSFLNYMNENRLDFMHQHVGFDVGMNDNLANISAMWDNFRGATFNIWQGDGLTNCANIIRGVTRLKDTIGIRNGQGHFRKVYYWTVDVMYHIRSILRLGLDAVLTNQPQRVLQVLEEPEFITRYRLATPYDDPFAQFWIKPSAWKMSFPSIGEVSETVTNIQKTYANFVKTLPTSIVSAMKKVHQTVVARTT